MGIQTHLNLDERGNFRVRGMLSALFLWWEKDKMEEPQYAC